MPNINEADLIDAVAYETGAAKTLVKMVLKAAGAVAADNLNYGADVSLPGLGKLKPTHRPARMGRNPKTQAVVEIPEKYGVRLAPSKPLLDLLNGR